MIGVGRNALRVKGDEDVDGGGELLVRGRLDFGGRLEYEGLAQEGGDLVAGPCCTHGVGKVTAESASACQRACSCLPGTKGTMNVRRVVDHKDVFGLPQAQKQPTLGQFSFARLAQTGSIAAAETQDFNMVLELGARQGEDGGGEKHGLIVRVGDQQADALAAQYGEAVCYYAHCVEIEPRHKQHEERKA